MVGGKELMHISNFDSKLATIDDKDPRQHTSKRFDSAIFDTESLIKSLDDVEQSHKQHLTPNTFNVNQVSPAESSTYGKVNALSIGCLRSQPSPFPSIAASEQTRASSRNTNQSYVSQMGPALVEEMTLSDLEDEISSSLMASKESHNKYINRNLYASSIDGTGFGLPRNRDPVVLPPTNVDTTSAFFNPTSTLNLQYQPTQVRDKYLASGPNLHL